MDTLAYYISILKADFQYFCLDKLKEFGVTKGLLFFVIYIGKHPGCLPKEVSKNLQVDAGYTTRAVLHLSELGLALSEPNKQDRRQKSLFLTEKGEFVFQKILQLFSAWDDRVTKGWSQEETDLFKKKMASMVIQVKENCDV